MTRLISDSFSGVHQFTYATVTTDLFKKEDVQVLALATNDHDHTVGLGHQIPTGGIVDGAITGAKINLSAVNLGGDLSGTLAAGHVALQNGSPISAYNNTSQVHPLLQVGADNNTNIYNAGAGVIRMLNQAGSAELFRVDNAANAAFSGPLAVGGNLGTSGSVTVGTGTIQLTAAHTSISSDGTNVFVSTDTGSFIVRCNNGAAIQTVAAGWAPLQCGALTVQAGSVMVGATNAVIQLGAGGPYWQNNAGVMACNASMIFPSATTNSITIAGGGTIDSGPAGYVRVSQLTVTPGPTATGNLQVNGNLNVTGTITGQSTSATTFNGDVILNAPRVISLGAPPSGALISPGTNLGKSADTAYIQQHLYVFYDIGCGHILTCQSLVQTSDPEAKQNAVTFTDADCMTRVRATVPVYSYQLPPPSGGDSEGPYPTATDIGFMATDVYTHSPEFAALDGSGNAVGVNYANMAALLWGALRGLDARVQLLETP